MNAKISQAGNKIVSCPRLRKLCDSLFPVPLCCSSREISAASKDRKGLTKDLNSRNSYEVICGCDIDEEVENLINPSLRQGFRIARFFADVIPLFEVETDLVIVVRKRRIVTKWMGFRTWRGFVNDVVDLMKRDGGFHLSV